MTLCKEAAPNESGDLASIDWHDNDHFVRFLGMTLKIISLSQNIEKISGDSFHLGGVRSDDGIWSWNDGSAWNYENFRNDEIKNRSFADANTAPNIYPIVLQMKPDKYWEARAQQWTDNYLCQYFL